MDPRQLLIALNAADRITRAALCRLAATAEEWNHLRPRDARGRALRGCAASLGVPAEQLRRALEVRRRAEVLAEGEQRLAERHRCRLITRLDPDYPRALFDHPLPPPVLYCRGRLPAGPAIAIVGSRGMDGYGGEVASLFARQLAAAGVTVVSGFALGVDGAAHRAALEPDSGTTVAVLGCGVDLDYPRAHRRLAREIPERGAVISEFPLGANPHPWHFPVRNRVIAALADGTLVVQAALRSGSLITAHQAMELGRDVWAVPGRIFDELALGTNALIADGALVARSPDDLLDRLDRLAPQGQQPLFPPPPGPFPAGAGTAAAENPPAGLPGKVLKAMPAGVRRTAEELGDELDQPVDRVLGALLELELAGWIRREPGPVYLR
jgi:DNA processing protein